MKKSNNIEYRVWTQTYSQVYEKTRFQVRIQLGNKIGQFWYQLAVPIEESCLE